MVIRDWSSDVCSSDLNLLALERSEIQQALTSYQSALKAKLEQVRAKYDLDGGEQLNVAAYELFDHSIARSEERRVGKECRSRWSPDH